MPLALEHLATPPGEPHRSIGTIVGSNFVSMIGTNLLSIGLAWFLFSGTASAVKAGAVLILTCLPPMLFGPPLASWLDRELNRRVLVQLELTAAVVSLGCGLLAISGASVWLLYAALIARSLACFLSKAGFARWLKLAAPAAGQVRAAKAFQASMLLSVFASGIVAGAIPLDGAAWLLAIVTADIATFLVSAALLLRLPSVPPPSPHPPALRPASVSPWATWRQMSATGGLLFQLMLLVCMGQTVFQATEMIVVTLGADRLGLGVRGMALSQLAAAAGLLTGLAASFLRPPLLGDPNHPAMGRAMAWSAAGLLVALLCTQLRLPSIALIALFATTFMYEYLDLTASAAFFRACDDGNVARLHASLRSTSTGLMALGILVFTLLIDAFGFAVGSRWWLGVCGLLWVVSLRLVIRSARGASLRSHS